MGKWCVLGGDARACCLRETVKARGGELTEQPPCDVLVLEFPRSNVPESMTKLLPPGQKIVCGLTNAAFEMLAQEKGWLLLRPLDDETFNLRNAVPSAEGAIFAAMQRFDSTIANSRCAVVGYGRIGKELTKMLRALDAQVWVAADGRKAGARRGRAA